jgi:hypothetical protein
VLFYFLKSSRVLDFPKGVAVGSRGATLRHLNDVVTGYSSCSTLVRVGRSPAHQSSRSREGNGQRARLPHEATGFGPGTDTRMRPATQFGPNIPGTRGMPGPVGLQVVMLMRLLLHQYTLVSFKRNRDLNPG